MLSVAYTCLCLVVAWLAFCGAAAPSQPPAASFPVTIAKTAGRLAVVLPFTEGDAAKLLQRLRSWEAEGEPCLAVRQAGAASTVSFVFWYARDFSQSTSKSLEHFVPAATQALRFMHHCFDTVQFLSANLSDAEDGYPAGPSFMWYKLMLENVTSVAPGGAPAPFSASHDCMFWMEHDVHVIRAGWLDRLWTECAAPRDFWVKGSAVRGHRANAFASSQPDAAQRDALLRWLGHVNGCALYDLSSPDFAALVRTTLDRHNPGTGWRPFDVALWRVLFYAEALLSGPGSPGPDWDWERDYARFAHKVQYSDFIQNWSEEYSPSVEADVRAFAPGTFFIHGADHQESRGEQLMRSVDHSWDKR